MSLSQRRSPAFPALPSATALLSTLNVLWCSGLLLWFNAHSMPGGPANYFNAMVYLGLTLYSLLEARMSRKAGDHANAGWWRNAALVIAAGGLVHHGLWTVLFPWLPDHWVNLSAWITPLISAASVIWLIQRNEASALTARPLFGDEPGKPFDLFMFMFSPAAALVVIGSEAFSMDFTWSALSASRPEGMALPAVSRLWTILGAVMALRLWTLYQRSEQGLPWSRVDQSLIALSALLLMSIGVSGLWERPHTMEAVLYFSSFLIWGGVQLVACVASSQDRQSAEVRDYWRILALGIQVGACLIPGNSYKLVELSKDMAGNMAYLLNNSYYTIAIYFVMNGFGIKVYTLRNLKKWNWGRKKPV